MSSVCEICVFGGQARYRCITAQFLQPSDLKLTLSGDGLLLLNDRIYVPDVPNLRLHVLKHKHNYPISGHFSQNKTLELICREYA